jgi:hypothetical protein
LALACQEKSEQARGKGLRGESGRNGPWQAISGFPIWYNIGKTEEETMATYVHFMKKEKRFIVTDDWSRAIYPCTQRRLNEVAKSQNLAIKIRSKRSPRLAIITRPNGKSIQTDRLWSLTRCLQEAAEIIHTLQGLDRGGKIKYYRRLGL